MSGPDYDLMVQTYHLACRGNTEPSLVILGSIKRTKAVRRRVGRLLRRGQVVKGEALWPMSMHKKHGALIV